jgi:GH25 family lysozyme M1 (1,4-beta-N-acetylmuramidase)
MATCRGVDVSVYQGAQDWAARKAEGVVFAFAKASEGQRTHDAHFATHITGIKNAGLIPGAYHFAWPNQDVALEAANYIAAVRPYAGRGFVHWLDLERRSDGANYKGCTAAGILAWVTKWLKLVSEAFPGQRVGVYTSGSDLAAGHVPAGTTIWYPAYTWGYTAVGYEKAEAAARPHPSGWSPLLWQFTSTPVDRSIAYLSAADLRAWAAGTTQEDTMPTADEIAQAVVTKLIAGGGVLENGDLDRIIDRDHVPAARPPYNNDDYFEADGKTPKNTTWKLGYALQTNAEYSRKAVALLEDIQDKTGTVALTDAQVAALATQLAAAPGLVDAIAAKVAADIAARLAE